VPRSADCERVKAVEKYPAPLVVGISTKSVAPEGLDTCMLTKADGTDAPLLSNVPVIETAFPGL
jgi:hypothetical protein